MEYRAAVACRGVREAGSRPDPMRGANREAVVTGREVLDE